MSPVEKHVFASRLLGLAMELYFKIGDMPSSELEAESKRLIEECKGQSIVSAPIEDGIVRDKSAGFPA
jgi:hypothetical protein